MLSFQRAGPVQMSKWRSTGRHVRNLPANGQMAMKSSKRDKNTPEAEWKEILSPDEFFVLRQKGTEPAGSGKYNKFDLEDSTGIYSCAGCGSSLFEVVKQFKSGCGWPAFWDTIPGAVDRTEDNAYGMQRTEITCSTCGGHLGHVFKGEGFSFPTDERHCVNSISIKLTK